MTRLLPADHRRLVLTILRAHWLHSIRAWVCGSRATSRARGYTDLDLDVGRRLRLDEFALLREVLSDSGLPFKVGFVDWHHRRSLAGDDRGHSAREPSRLSD